jgi:hypothetical protein
VLSTRETRALEKESVRYATFLGRTIRI